MWERAELWGDLGWYERLQELGWNDRQIAEWTTDLLDLREQGQQGKMLDALNDAEETFMLQAPDFP